MGSIYGILWEYIWEFMKGWHSALLLVKLFWAKYFTGSYKPADNCYDIFLTSYSNGSLCDQTTNEGL